MTTNALWSGRCSCGFALAGMLLPLCLRLVPRFVGSSNAWPLPALGLELIALLAGIAGRRTPGGKAGIVLSVVFSLLTLTLTKQPAVTTEPVVTTEPIRQEEQQGQGGTK